MITATNVELRAGARVLLESAFFRVASRDRVGLVGRNGAGKTTLARALAGESGEAEPAAGTIQRSGTVGYLPQDSRTGNADQLARDRILSVRGLDVAAAGMRTAETEMTSADGTRRDRAMRRHERLENEFFAKGGYVAEAEAATIAAGLGLPDRVLGQRLGTLSGGQRRRIELARILYSDAQTLLLDEPTNHLDADSIVWLRQFLTSFDGAVLVISHDVNLVEYCVNRVFHLDADRAELDIYNLGWRGYINQRETDERRRRRENANAEKKAAQLQYQADRMRYKATKAVAAQNMERRAQQLRANQEEAPRAEKVAKIRFPEPASCGKTPLAATGLSKSYGSLEVFADVDLAVDSGSRVVVLGLNGAGKTTLLRVLAGQEEPDTGSIQQGHGLKIGYYAQEHETLDPNGTVRENMRAAAPDTPLPELRKVLGSFLFSGDDVDKRVSVLSGGEKTRLALATLVVSSANVLLLDEPTNNLDPASREEILRTLRSYTGAVVLVSHDDGAVDALAPERVILLPDGTEDFWDDSYRELVSLT